MKRFYGMLVAIAAMLVFTGCGEKVLIKNDEVAKQISSSGLDDEIITSGSHKLDACFPGQACPKLVKLRVGEESVLIPGNYHIASDKMSLGLDVFIQYGLKKEKEYLDQVFNRTKAENENSTTVMVISSEKVYNVFIKPELKETIRAAINNYKMEYVMANPRKVRIFVENEIKKLFDKTPIKIISVRFDRIGFPEPIEKANIRDKEIELDKAIQLKSFKAQLEIEKAKFELEKERARMALEVDRIVSDSMTPELSQWLLLNAINKSAENGTPWSVNMERTPMYKPSK